MLKWVHWYSVDYTRKKKTIQSFNILSRTRWKHKSLTKAINSLQIKDKLVKVCIYLLIYLQTWKRLLINWIYNLWVFFFWIVKSYKTQRWWVIHFKNTIMSLGFTLFLFSKLYWYRNNIRMNTRQSFTEKLSINCTIKAAIFEHL